jgi:DNA-binding winged helix-turn-helix (wHTH) protein
LDRKHLPSPGSPGFTTEQAAGRAEQALAFAGFRLEADGSLFRGNSLIHLPPRELAALRLLLANAGQIVTPLQLKKALWGDVHVTADSVPRCLSSLRARMQPEDCIQTVYKRGYRLLAEVQTQASAIPAPLPRLAIIPFATEMGVPDHMGMAIADEATARQSNLRPSKAQVLARDSVFTLAERGQTAQQIGETLGADLVLTGTLRAFISHFRLRVEMIRIADGVQLWVEDLLATHESIAALETELADRLDFRLRSGPLDSSQTHLQSPGSIQENAAAGAVTAALSSRSAESFAIYAAAAPSPESASNPPASEAYELYLRGRHEWQTLERHRMQDGLRHLTRATELDPSLVAAKINLIHLCVTQAFYGYMSPAAAADLLCRTADSISVNPRQAEAILPALGWVRLNIDRNLQAACWAFDNSAHLPHNIFNTRERVMFSLSRLRHDEAAELNEAALREDPFSPWLHARQAWIAHLAGHAEVSVELARRGLEMFPGHDGISLYAAMILTFNGDSKRGVEIADSLIRRQPHVDLLTAVQAYTLASDGQTAEARALMEKLKWLSRERFVLKSFNPAVHVALGDFEAAVADLRAADQDRCPWFLQLLADPRLKPLNGHPGFEELKAILPGMEDAARGNADRPNDDAREY